MVKGSFSRYRQRTASLWAGGQGFVIGFALILMMLAFSSNAATPARITALSTQITQLEQTLNQNQSDIKLLEQAIWALDHKILETRRQLRRDRDQQRTQLHEARRDLSLQNFEVERLERAIKLLAQDMELTEKDSQRAQEYFESLNPLRRPLEADSHRRRLEANTQKIAAIAQDRQRHQDRLILAQGKLKILDATLLEQRQQTSDMPLDEDPELLALLQEREGRAARITSLRSQVREQLATLETVKNERLRARRLLAQQQAAPTPPAQQISALPPSTPPTETQPIAAERLTQPSHVFVISGAHVPNIENHLKLKEWVESYGARYIEARWNGIANNASAGTLSFQEDFARQLRSIPVSAKIVLIGHGLGGGAAIEAATRIAFDMDRTIDFLAVLDPIGTENMRANIVYQTSASCKTTPLANDPLTNMEYLACIRAAKPRLITANVKHFYNRWQKESQGPLDYQRRIKAIDSEGKDIDSPTATGRFITSNAIVADQKRTFFNNSVNAHELLLKEEAKNLPKLLVRHLR